MKFGKSIRKEAVLSGLSFIDYKQLKRRIKSAGELLRTRQFAGTVSELSFFFAELETQLAKVRGEYLQQLQRIQDTRTRLQRAFDAAAPQGDGLCVKGLASLPEDTLDASAEEAARESALKAKPEDDSLAAASADQEGRHTQQQQQQQQQRSSSPSPSEDGEEAQTSRWIAALQRLPPLLRRTLPAGAASLEDVLAFLRSQTARSDRRPSSSKDEHNNPTPSGNPTHSLEPRETPADAADGSSADSYASEAAAAPSAESVADSPSSSCKQQQSASSEGALQEEPVTWNEENRLLAEALTDFCVQLQDASARCRELRRFVIWNTIATVKILKKRRKLLCTCTSTPAPQQALGIPTDSDARTRGGRLSLPPQEGAALASSRTFASAHPSASAAASEGPAVPCVGCCLVEVAESLSREATVPVTQGGESLSTLRVGGSASGSFASSSSPSLSATATTTIGPPSRNIITTCFSSAASLLRRECWYSSLALPHLLSGVDTLSDSLLQLLTGAPPSPEKYLCPICLDLIEEPVTLRACCHRFCFGCLAAAASAGPGGGDPDALSRCPSCRTSIVPLGEGEGAAESASLSEEAVGAAASASGLRLLPRDKDDGGEVRRSARRRSLSGRRGGVASSASRASSVSPDEGDGAEAGRESRLSKGGFQKGAATAATGAEFGRDGGAFAERDSQRVGVSATRRPAELALDPALSQFLKRAFKEDASTSRASFAERDTRSSAAEASAGERTPCHRRSQSPSSPSRRSQNSQRRRSCGVCRDTQEEDREGAPPPARDQAFEKESLLPSAFLSKFAGDANASVAEGASVGGNLQRRLWARQMELALILHRQVVDLQRLLIEQLLLQPDRGEGQAGPDSCLSLLEKAFALHAEAASTALRHSAGCVTSERNPQSPCWVFNPTQRGEGRAAGACLLSEWPSVRGTAERESGCLYTGNLQRAQWHRSEGPVEERGCLSLVQGPLSQGDGGGSADCLVASRGPCSGESFMESCNQERAAASQSASISELVLRPSPSEGGVVVAPPLYQEGSSDSTAQQQASAFGFGEGADWACALSLLLEEAQQGAAAFAQGGATTTPPPPLLPPASLGAAHPQQGLGVGSCASAEPAASLLKALSSPEVLRQLLHTQQLPPPSPPQPLQLVKSLQQQHQAESVVEKTVPLLSQCPPTGPPPGLSCRPPSSPWSAAPARSSKTAVSLTETSCDEGRWRNAAAEVGGCLSNPTGERGDSSFSSSGAANAASSLCAPSEEAFNLQLQAALALAKGIDWTWPSNEAPAPASSEALPTYTSQQTPPVFCQRTEISQQQRSAESAACSLQLQTAALGVSLPAAAGRRQGPSSSAEEGTFQRNRGAAAPLSPNLRLPEQPQKLSRRQRRLWRQQLQLQQQDQQEQQPHLHQASKPQQRQPLLHSSQQRPRPPHIKQEPQQQQPHPFRHCREVRHERMQQQPHLLQGDSALKIGGEKSASRSAGARETECLRHGSASSSALASASGQAMEGGGDRGKSGGVREEVFFRGWAGNPQAAGFANALSGVPAGEEGVEGVREEEGRRGQPAALQTEPAAGVFLAEGAAALLPSGGSGFRGEGQRAASGAHGPLQNTRSFLSSRAVGLSNSDSRERGAIAADAVGG